MLAQRMFFIVVPNCTNCFPSFYFYQFPDFYLCGPSFNDLRTILLNTKKGIYPNIKALRSDLQRLLKTCTTYLHIVRFADECCGGNGQGRKEEMEKYAIMGGFAEKLKLLVNDEDVSDSCTPLDLF